MLTHPNERYVTQLVVGTIICCTASFIAVVLRFIARKVGGFGYGWDDLAIVIAMVSLLLECCNDQLVGY